MYKEASPVYKETCNRITVCLVVFFVATTLLLVGILCWREFIVHQVDTRITRDNLIKYYPSIFGLYTYNKSYQDILLDAYFKRTPTTSFFQPKTNCSYDCYLNVTRAKRTTTQTQLNHACCQSSPRIVVPRYYNNLRNNLRELVQFNNTAGFPLLQIFLQEDCSQAIGCTGCSCQFVYQVTSAVVYKIGYTPATATDMSQLEVDLFELQGCCKCINYF